MTSKERVLTSLNHNAPDRIPVDFGGTNVTGMHVQVVEGLRNYFGLDWKPVKIIDPMQMLGEIDDELRKILKLDTISVIAQKNKFGTENAKWKEFKTFWGQTVLFPGTLPISTGNEGKILLHPEGDLSAKPSAEMAKAAFFFDAIIRQEPIDESKLNPEDNLEEYSLITEDALAFWENKMGELEGTDKAVCVSFGGMALGDIAVIPGLGLKNPKGIRDITEWYISTLTRQDYIHTLFEKQTDIALQNLTKLFDVVGNKVDVIYICGTDFGTQQSLFCSIEMFNELYAPYYRKLNKWIHENTSWKTFKHSCGAVEALMQSFIDSGFDIINPVQINAEGMDAHILKKNYGDFLTFWGGGIDTQKTLPFGTPQDVEEQVKKQCSVLGKNGGFVFNAVHNIQANTPVENVVAMFKAIEKV